MQFVLPVFIAIFSMHLSLAANTKMPDFPAGIKAMLPAGFKVIESGIADLNADGLTDYLLVLEQLPPPAVFFAAGKGRLHTGRQKR